MFNESKYTTWYNSIISSPDLEGELHHIIPRSLGGIDDENNLVKLSLRKHFICHLLLTKMVDDSKSIHKMLHALKMMSKTRHINSHIYERMKIKFRELKYVLIYNKDTDEEKYLYDGEPLPIGFEIGGRPKSEEWKDKLRGRKQSKEHIEKRTKMNGGRKKYEHKITKQRSFFIGQPDDNWLPVKKEKQRRSISEGRTGQVPFYNPLTNECKLFRAEEQPPTGWIKGRSSNGRNGYKQTENQKRKVKEANQKNYIVVWNNGVEETFTGLGEWLTKNKINKSSFDYRRKLGQLSYLGIKSIEILQTSHQN